MSVFPPLLAYLLTSPCVEGDVKLDGGSVTLVARAWHYNLDDITQLLQKEGPNSFGLFNVARDKYGPHNATSQQICENVLHLLGDQIGFLCGVHAKVSHPQLFYRCLTIFQGFVTINNPTYAYWIRRISFDLPRAQGKRYTSMFRGRYSLITGAFIATEVSPIITYLAHL